MYADPLGLDATDDTLQDISRVSGWISTGAAIVAVGCTVLVVCAPAVPVALAIANAGAAVSALSAFAAILRNCDKGGCIGQLLAAALTALASRFAAGKLIGRAAPAISQPAANTGDEAVSGGRYLFNTWHKATFPNRTQSVNYHLAKHGKGRSASQYTRDAMDFFAQNRSLGQSVILRDSTAGIKISTKQQLPGGGVQRVGGYWTDDGRLVTFWD